MMKLYMKSEMSGTDSMNSTIINSGDSGYARSCDVPVVDLDTWEAKEAVQRVDFIKIDVEGAESMVLAGAKRLLDKYEPYVLVEFSVENHSRANSDWGGMTVELRERNYIFIDLLEQKIIKDEVPRDDTDVLCVPPKYYQNISKLFCGVGYF